MSFVWLTDSVIRNHTCFAEKKYTKNLSLFLFSFSPFRVKGDRLYIFFSLFFATCFKWGSSCELDCQHFLLWGKKYKFFWRTFKYYPLDLRILYVMFAADRMELKAVQFCSTCCSLGTCVGVGGFKAFRLAGRDSAVPRFRFCIEEEHEKSNKW